MLQVKGAPCQNLPDNGWLQMWVCSRCWYPLNLPTVQHHQNPNCICPNCVPRYDLSSRGWGVSGELNEPPFPSEAFSLMRTAYLGCCAPWGFFVCGICGSTVSSASSLPGYSTGMNSCRTSSAFTLTGTIYGANILCENNKPHGKPYFSAPCEIFP